MSSWKMTKSFYPHDKLNLCILPYLVRNFKVNARNKVTKSLFNIHPLYKASSWIWLFSLRRIFRPNQKQIKHLNFRISGQKISTGSKVRYLSVILEEHLDWNLHIDSLKHNLNRAIRIVSKIWHYVPKFLLNTLYYTMFHCHLIYSCQIWGQKSTILRKLEPLQNKAMRIISLKNNEYNVNEL